MNSSKSRRKFLYDAGCAALGGSTLISTILNLNALNASAGYHNTEDYRALVCILQAGGNDSFNMLVPRGVSEYSEYQTVRGGLALDQNVLLPLQNGFNNNRELGLHPSLVNIANLYDDGNAAFIANVGSLVEPINLTEYETKTKDIPLGLFSHVDQIAHWQTSLPHKRDTVGWGGRMADLLSTVYTNQNISMNISLSGGNLFQTGTSVRPFAITEEGAISMNGYNGMTLFDQVRTSGMDSLMNTHYENLFDITYRDVLKKSNDSNLIFDQAISNLPPLQTTFSTSNPISQNLEMIVKTIAARTELQMSRQVFFINFGGWDHHDEVLNAQSAMLSTLDTALGEFYTGLEEINMTDKVTTFTISDFGRTLTSNGNGSDHAWGGNVLVMGGDVTGNDIYGIYPDLYLGNPQDVGRGRLIPTTSTEEYFAELALWFGVPKSDLDMVLPNIHSFYNILDQNPPIGFMNQV